MSDPTEGARKERIAEIELERRPGETEAEARARLEAAHGQVWTTGEMTLEFVVEGFAAPYVVVRRLSDGKRGSLEFAHSPRFYFNFREG